METKIFRRTLYKEYDDKYFFFNSFTNSIATIKKNYGDNFDDILAKNENYLLEEGVIFQDVESYYELMDFFYHKYTVDTSHITITDAPYFSCNLKCVYCMQQNTPLSINDMSPEERFDLWKQIFNILSAEKLSVCLFGGEPFYDKKYVKELLTLAKNDDIVNLNKVFAVTNGTLIDDDIINMINDFNIYSLQITLDGTKEIHDIRRITKKNTGSFDLIVSNIEKILDNTDAEICINTVIDKSNFDGYFSMIDSLIAKWGHYILAKEPRIIFNVGNECDPVNGCAYTSCNNMLDSDGLMKYYDLLYELLQKGVSVNGIIPAAACLKDSFHEVILGPDGSLYNCISGIGIDDYKICSKNELYDYPASALAKIAKSCKSPKDKSCRLCSYYGMCNGGCYYDMISNNKKSSCQKKIFDDCIDKMMDIFSVVEERGHNTFVLKQPNNN